MTLPPYRPTDHLGQALAYLQAAKSFVAQLQADNASSPNRSVRFDHAGAALEQLINAVAILGALQRETQSDVADLHVKGFERDIGAQNQMTAYPTIYPTINEAINKSEDATDGFTAAQALRAAVRYIVRVVDSLVVGSGELRAKIARAEASRKDLDALKSEVAALKLRLKPVLQREADIDRWESDALKGGDDATGN